MANRVKELGGKLPRADKQNCRLPDRDHRTASERWPNWQKIALDFPRRPMATCAIMVDVPLDTGEAFDRNTLLSLNLETVAEEIDALEDFPHRPIPGYKRAVKKICMVSLTDRKHLYVMFEGRKECLQLKVGPRTTFVPTRWRESWFVVCDHPGPVGVNMAAEELLGILRRPELPDHLEEAPMVYLIDEKPRDDAALVRFISVTRDELLVLRDQYKVDISWIFLNGKKTLVFVPWHPWGW